MRDVHIMVEVELMRSNGNYGRDRAVCQLSATLDADDNVDNVQGYLLGQATRTVEHQLASSTSLEVRRTMLRKPRVCNECKEPLGDDEDYLHPACEEIQLERRQRQDEERRARREAERAEQEAQWEAERTERKATARLEAALTEITELDLEGDASLADALKIAHEALNPPPADDQVDDDEVADVDVELEDLPV